VSFINLVLQKSKWGEVGLGLSCILAELLSGTCLLYEVLLQGKSHLRHDSTPLSALYDPRLQC